MSWYVLVHRALMYIPVCTGIYLSVLVHTSTSMYLYIPVHTCMYWYVQVHTSMYWYVLVCTCTYSYVLLCTGIFHSFLAGWQLNPYSPTQVQQAQEFRIFHGQCRLGSC